MGCFDVTQPDPFRDEKIRSINNTLDNYTDWTEVDEYLGFWVDRNTIPESDWEWIVDRQRARFHGRLILSDIVSRKSIQDFLDTEAKKQSGFRS